MCCSPWGHKESDMNELLNNNKGQDACKEPTKLWSMCHCKMARPGECDGRIVIW